MLQPANPVLIVFSSCDTGCVATPVRGSPQEGGAGWEAGDWREGGPGHREPHHRQEEVAETVQPRAPGTAQVYSEERRCRGQFLIAVMIMSSGVCALRLLLWLRFSVSLISLGLDEFERSGDSTVCRTSDQKAWCNIIIGLSLQCSSQFFSLESTFNADSLMVSMQPPCAIACINSCVHIKNPKHWQSYHCLNAWKFRTHCKEWVLLLLQLLRNPNFPAVRQTKFYAKNN